MPLDLTPKEVEEMLGIPLKTLATWRTQNKGPAYHKLGGKVRYSEEDIKDWHRNCRVVTDDCKD